MERLMTWKISPEMDEVKLFGFGNRRSPFTAQAKYRRRNDRGTSAQRRAALRAQ